MPNENRPHALLCIDHHSDTNRMFAKLLRHAGFNVYTAGTLGDAEHILSAHPIDLMLCRITASDGDGAVFIERVYKQYRVPSLALAGSLENQSRAARLLPDAMRGILSMPVELPTVHLAIASALRRTGRRVGVCPDCNGTGNISLLT